MPLPLFIAIGAGTALTGVIKGIKAGVDTKEASDVNANANTIVDNAKKHLELYREKSGKALEILGSKKVFVLDKSISRFIVSFEKLKNVDLQDSVGLDELSKFKIDKQSLQELRDLCGFASSILVGAAMTFGAASTGTAIATLSGAAATNATLAFLGGGSLAAGGLGIAGGAAVLGGLVTGPALAILGFVIGAKASANLDKAYSNLSEAKKFSEEMKTAALACNAIRRRSYMFTRLFIRLETVFTPLIHQLEAIIVKSGENYATFTSEEKQIVAASASIAGAIKTLLDTPILSEDGKLTDKSEQIANECGGLLEHLPEMPMFFLLQQPEEY